LGVGATTAVLVTLDQFLVQSPAGVVSPATLERLHQRFLIPMTREARTRAVFSYVELRAIASELSDAGVAGFIGATVSGGAAQARREMHATYVLGDYFGLLGVKPHRGRFFSSGEYGRQTGTTLAVISDALWAQDFGRESTIIGRSVTIGARRFDIIGVAPRGFTGIDPEPTDLWLPFNAADDGPDAESKYSNAFDLRLNVVVRQAPRGSADGLAAITRALRKGPIPDGTAQLVPVRRWLDPMRDAGAATIVVRLAWAAAAILMIVCANVATLLLVRASARRREIAIRFAMGGTRARLGRQILVETLVLGVLAAIAASIVAVWAAGALQHMLVPSVHWRTAPHRLAASIALVLAMVAALGAGFAPVAHLDESALGEALKLGPREVSAHGAAIRAGMLVIQIALSVVLLTAAALFLRSLSHARHAWVLPGSEDVVIASLATGLTEPTSTELQSVVVVANRIARVPGVQRVALGANTPIIGTTIREVFLPGRDSVPKVPGHVTTIELVSPGFLTVMGLSLVAGRDFVVGDGPGSELVALVSDYMAKRFWPGESAIGKCIVVEQRDGPCRMVVGVVQNVHAMKLAEPLTFRYYIPLAQFPKWAPRVVLVRAQPGHRDAVRTHLRDAVASQSRASWRIRDFSDILDPELRPWRVSATLFSALALLGIIVAAVGTFSNVAFVVSQRVRDIGIRRSLGAGNAAIVGMVLSSTGRLIFLGVMLGAVSAVGLGRFLRALVYNISPIDPFSLCLAVGVFLLGGVAACLLPVRAALKVDPVLVLAAD
jgi:ABC-type antimicrobial peptide transport system, permease component